MRLIRWVVFFFAVTMAPLAHAAAAPAHAAPITAAASEGRGTPNASLIDRVRVWILQKQTALHRQLQGYLRDIRGGAGFATIWTLIGLSFVYGVLHAAGPGHGKAVMTGFLLTHPATVRRGVLLAAASAFCQGLVAIVIVYGLVAVVGMLPRDTQSAVIWSERASFALIALLGAALVLRAGRGLWRLRVRAGRSPDHGVHAHGHGHDHDAGCCDHRHVPTSAQIANVTDLKTAVALVLSIGIRPCTGAIIVLLFASLTSLNMVGIGAVMAMSAGTAISVATLAFMAVTARNMAARLPFMGGGRAALAANVVAVIGGGMIFALGAILLVGAFQPAHPLFSG